MTAPTPPIRTVLGDVPPSALGVTYAHEHVIIAPSFTTHLHPEFLLDDVDRAVEELRSFHAAGGRAMVDSMPCGGGRNVLMLADVSRRAGVHILCPTGLHLARYYPPGHWAHRLDADALADLFVADVAQGIDANDYGGPDVRRTPHRAGHVKIASGLNGLNDRERVIFEAAAAAHRRTGAPILTHTEQGTGALQQVALLARFGVPPAAVILSHTDRKPDPAYHREILSTGVNVEFDSAFRWPADAPRNPTADLVVSSFAHGHGRQVMLGMDTARRSYWKSHGGSPGLTYLLDRFRPQLRAAGLTDADLHAIFVTNPARAYALRQSEADTMEPA